MSHDSLNSPARNSAPRLELTAAQRGIWYAQKLAPENPMFQIGQFVEILGPLDHDVLAAAIRHTVEGTPALTMEFAEDSEGPFQTPRTPRAALDVTDLADAADPEAQARALMDADLRIARNPATDQLLHTELIRLAPERHFFYQRVHHLLLDGYSAVLVLRQVADLYNRLWADDGRQADGGPDLGRFQELLAEEAGYPESAAATADRTFWDTALDGAPAASGLAGRPDGSAGSLVRASMGLPAGAAAALEEAQASAPALVLTAAALYLHRITGERNVSVALPVTARRGHLAKSTPSMLSNIVPIRLTVNPAATVADTVAAVGRSLRGALVHQRFRYEDLAAGGGYLGPSVNILPVLDDISFGAAKGTMNILSTGPVDDLSIVVHGLGAGAGDQLPTIQFEANAGMYTQEVLAGHLDRFVRLLAQVATPSGALLADLEVTTPAEEQQLLAAGEAEPRALPGHTIVEEFQLSAAARPHHTAIVASDGSLTFAELENRSNQLARFLTGHGAGPGTTVAVRLDRGLLLPVALLAVLKCGAAYLPLDPDYPADRVEGMIEDAAPVRIITSTAFTAAESDAGNAKDARHAELTTPVPVTVLDSPLMEACLAAKSSSALQPRAGQQDLAYVIFTSGSTGRPKGVGVEHLALLNLFTAHRDSIFRPAETRLGRRLKVAHTAGLSFDASWDPILWLVAGHELHLVDNQTRRDPEALNAYLSGARIDSIETTPSFAKVLVAGGLFDHDPHPSVVALGGEAVDAELWDDLAGRDGVVAYNLYGPTETTVDSLTAVMEPGTSPTLGGSVANTRHYILDSGLNPVPDNAVGELYVAGINLARGYLDQPGLSSERFVADPFAMDGSRMYRTGDIVRRRDDGTLEFRGRLDAQVKIRGFRIEPAEIEQVLRALQGVEHAAVTVGTNRAGYDQLLAYVTPSPAAGGEPREQLDTAALRREARRHLPDYMVPAAIMQIPSLPLTPNGKLDTRSLPLPEQDTTATAPRNDRERIVADAFCEVLGLEAVGLEDDFFDLGGHSLLATRLAALLRERTGTAPALRTIFENTTVAALAETLELGTATSRPLTAGPRPEALPLSFAQRRLWFLNRLDPGSGAYNIPVVLTLRGPLHVAALDAALGQLAARHETLRTIFPLVDGEPTQRILPAAEGRPAMVAVQCSAADLPAALASETGRGFSLDRELPLRAVLFQLARDHHVLAITLHHIAADGWSLAPLARDLSAGYNAFAAGREVTLPALPVQYADYTLWQRAELGSESDPDSAISRQLEFWSRELRGLPDELVLPFDYTRGTRDDAALPAGSPASSVPVAIRPETAGQLNALAREHNASLFMVLQAALAALLTKSGAGDDIPLGTPVAGRTDTQLDNLVGFFVNTLVLRTNTSGNPTAGDLVDSVRYTNLHAYANQDAPFERVVEELRPARSQHRHPLFQVMLTLQNTATAELGMDGLDATADQTQEAGGAKFDLLLDLAEQSGGITGSLSFNPALFRHGTAEKLAEGFLAVVEQFAADPGVTLDRLRIQSVEQHAVALARSSVPFTELPEETVVDAFLATAAGKPLASAVVDSGGRAAGLDFGSLRQRVEAAAKGLIALGVQPGDSVAVALPRTVDVATAALAVLAAGAVYIPVDLSYPAERIAMILDDGAPALVVGTPGAFGPDGHGSAPRTVTLDMLRAAGTGITDAALAGRHPVPADPAYVLFTSGSTGRPKGVSVSHGALANLYSHHFRTLYRPRFEAAHGAPVAVAHIAGLGFDAAWDPMLWLVAGAELHMVSDAVRTDAEALAAYCREHTIDVLETTPSYAAQLLQVGLLPNPGANAEPSARPPLLLLLGGEAVPPALWNSLAAMPGVDAYNFYGPTEFTVDSVTAPIRGTRPAIGTGIANTATLVLDQHLALVPAGIPGELYLAGAGMAQGYHRRSAETASRFVANPYAADGTRMYRTGDIVRRTEAGSLEFIARNDDQVKVRGFRIEPGDIESALTAHASVDLAVVLPDGQPAHRLVAYYTGTATPEEVLGQAAERLPDYMVPAIVMPIPELPLTTHGKLDRKALPAPAVTGTGRGDAPRTPDELTMAAIFSAVLSVDNVAMGDDFFALGGHSLLAIDIMGRIRKAFGTDLPLRTLFDAPTPAGLLAAARPAASGQQDDKTASADGPAVSSAAPLGDWLAGPGAVRPDQLELSHAQSRMWFLNQLDPGAADYNISLAVGLKGALNESALAKAVEALFHRHEVLRTIYPEINGVPEQRILPAGSDATATMGLLLATAVSQEDATAQLTVQAGRGFDVRTDLPLRACLIRVASPGEETHWVLHLVLHHIAADGASLAPLAQDLSAAYTAVLDAERDGNGTSPEPAPLPLQYADFSTWQRQQLAGPALAAKLDHWRHALAGIPAELTLPADHRRPRAPRQPGRQVGFQVPAESVTALTSVASSSNASLFMALHASLAAYLHRAGAGEDLVIGSPTAGRPDPLLAPLVGFFVNTLPLRVSTGGSPDLRTLLTRSRASILDAFDHDDVPFERLVEAMAPERELGRHPLFQTMLTVDSEAPAVPQLPGVDVAPAPEAGSGEAKFDLSFTFRPATDGALSGTLDYNAAMFEPETAQRLVAGFCRLLDLAAASPDVPVQELPLLDGATAQSLVAATAGARSSSPEMPVDQDILAAFAATVHTTPDAVAVVAGGASLSFADLAASAERVAGGLTATGAEGDVVSVMLPRSAATVQGLLGVLLSGRAYNPIDTEYPDHRVAAILEDARPAVVLTTATEQPRLADILSALDVQPKVLLVEDLLKLDAPAPLYGADSRGLASVMFTSGSTGRPKGVEVSHGALAALLDSHRESLLAGISRRRVAHTTGVGFDASWDPILWMVSGHELHMLDDGLRRDAPRLAAYFVNHGIGAWETTPGYLRQLLDQAEFSGFLAEHPGGPDAFSLALGGEAFDADLWASVSDLTGVRAWNLYGPTEAAVDTVVASVANSSTPELGRPTPGTRLYVLDDRLQHGLPGAAGELYIGGAQLARGYRGRPDLTAERFVPDPFRGGGERMYRTGDMVYRSGDGRLVFAGRNDGQLKIRGFRVEPGEVESAMRTAEGVGVAVVRAVGNDAGTRLVGYVVPVDEPAHDLADAVREHVRAILPDYMVPSAVMVIPEVPLTPHGKVDTAALPDPATATRAGGKVPRTPQEKAVARIFAYVLSLDRAGIDESFFELGGHSFLAQPLIARINAALGTDLQVQSLFRAPTVERLLKEAAQGSITSTAESLKQVLPLRTAGSKHPLFAVHPASGISWGFASMLGTLDPERPLIALQMPGMEPGRTHPVNAGSLTELADDYIQQIRSVQPEGPYHLLGWSFGGYLAHRLATRLQETGHEVAFLAILDAFPGNQEHNGMPGQGPGLWANYLEAQGYDLTGEDLSAVDLHRAQEILRANHNPLGTVPPDSVAAMAANFPALARLIREEQPQTFAGDLLFFRATEQVPEGTPGSDSWARYVTGTITDVPVPERHSELLSDRALSTIMPALAIRLATGSE
ncbi:amino acid adenylation domain-containing protein [Arthrobacter sp. AG258]|uniref:non-ribosomal peptide synthetase n=1 Tax=Arthrobacter sp. AG258 TaxID=2183899 RepID=UPI0010618359|nr:non-ribosomal peptide synthetase [Arthrobacter sp. AG258]TDT85825.1 amino acid adenylation domain-containing protein [Arthrobacter sp. AG258]